jgi:dissimilatory sulfite reductase (desulfoviridin) alpha/beta subunit
MLWNILSRLKKNAHVKPKGNPFTVLYHYQIDPEECRGCDKCKKACKTGTISGEHGKSHVIDEQKCIKCGTCIKWCKYKAIKQLDVYYGQTEQ